MVLFFAEILKNLQLMALALIFLLVQGARTQEVATPASLLGPRSYNHHAYDGQYLQELGLVDPTKQGPVLFPNDSPPAPRPPLIVTARPLIESIARSELNNSLAQPSLINRVTFQPGFLARVKDYKPFTYPVPTVVPVLNYENGGYPDVLKKGQVHAVGRDRYNDYEAQSVLPPIYKVLSDHANNNVLRIQQHKDKPHYDYQVKEPSYSHIDRTGKDDQDDHGNYAFSYTVKDQKTGDDFSHSQQSSGSATNGEYRVRLPDGRMQIVSYTADENGYKADVRYDDEDKTSGNSIDNNYNDNSKDYHNNYEHNDRHDYSNNYVHNNDYKTDDNLKHKVPTNDYYNADSKEYYNDDFSSEYDSKSYDYEPHRSKYTNYNGNSVVPDYKNNYNNKYSTVKPSYEELKDLLVDKNVYSTIQPNKSPVEINVPSTTPISFDATTERVVLIGQTNPKLYTNIKNSIPVSPFPILSNFVSSTPRSYLVSTIANLKNKVSSITAKPILSDSFINRINKYLSFN